MSILNAIFVGAKALVQYMAPAFRTVAPTLKETVRLLVEQIDQSVLGRALTQTLKNINQTYFVEAKNLAEEERELAKKRKRDGRFRDADLDRMEQIRRDREEIMRKLCEAKMAETQDELKAANGELTKTQPTLEELSATIGMVTSKECPSCGGLMQLVQSRYMRENGKHAGTHAIWWACIQVHHRPCPTEPLELSDTNTILRRPDPDLDGNVKDRRAVWERSDVLAKTHRRLQEGLGQDDDEMICPVHAMPMRLLPIPHADGRMLSSYHFACLGVNLDGSACRHSVPVQSFPQVSRALRRRGNGGIIDA